MVLWLIGLSRLVCASPTTRGGPPTTDEQRLSLPVNHKMDDDDFGDFTTQPAETVEDFLEREKAVLGDDADLFEMPSPTTHTTQSNNAKTSKMEEIDDFSQWTETQGGVRVCQTNGKANRVNRTFLKLWKRLQSQLHRQSRPRLKTLRQCLQVHLQSQQFQLDRWQACR